MGGEIMFYNGFNLFIDLIIAGVVGVTTFHMSKRHLISEGMAKALDWIDDGVLFKTECGGEFKWTFDPTKCQGDCCVPAPDNVTPLFSSREAD